MTNLTLQQRFEAKIRVTPGCWLWTASKNLWGYGRIGYRGKVIAAHRASYALYKGNIPDGMNVLHKCDNPACVNPDHLFLGTQAENMQDMITKGRGVSEERRAALNWSTKLTPDDVRRIRADCRKQKEIAQEYGVYPSTISKIKLGIRWDHV